nr:MAG TPA: hypothetical protein [Crassvirales sp.]
MITNYVHSYLCMVDVEISSLQMIYIKIWFQCAVLRSMVQNTYFLQ